MVEGPGCRLNGEKIRLRLKRTKQTVLTITDNTNHGGGAQGELFQCLSGCEYTGVETLGKELFMYFGDRALRLHFGMDGWMRINTTESKDKGKPPSLIISLSEDTLTFYSTTAEIRLSEDCSEKVRLMVSLDVCSPSFSVCDAVKAVCRESSRRVCDVLLDQSVLPGVGNIIKNEALFLTALNPAVKVNQLKTELVHHLVKMTRDFTLVFYQCRKSGSALHKHCSVYKRSSCGQCSGSVTVCRLGNDNRMTYFCSRCQTEDPSEIDISKLPGLSSWLRGTSRRPTQDVDHVATKEEEEWSCDLCTLVNRPIIKFCEACLSPRPLSRSDSVTDPQTCSALIRYPHNTFSKPQQEVKLHRRAAFGNTTLILSDLSPGPASAPSRTTDRTNGVGLESDSRTAGIGTQPTGPLISKRASPGFPSIPSKRRKMESGRMTGGEVQDKNQHASSSSSASLPTIPCCTTHHRPSVLRVVTKEGDNKGRQFYTCALPRGSQCNFFEWADLHFPTCHHGKRTLIRTVLKLGPNNGRRFYVCPLKHGKQCEFFKWAEQSL